MSHKIFITEQRQSPETTIVPIQNNFIKSEQKKRDTLKDWPLIKNPQFSSNPYETL